MGTSSVDCGAFSHTGFPSVVIGCATVACFPTVGVGVATVTGFTVGLPGCGHHHHGRPVLLLTHPHTSGVLVWSLMQAAAHDGITRNVPHLLLLAHTYNEIPERGARCTRK